MKGEKKKNFVTLNMSKNRSTKPIKLGHRTQIYRQMAGSVKKITQVALFFGKAQIESSSESLRDTLSITQIQNCSPTHGDY